MFKTYISEMAGFQFEDNSAEWDMALDKEVLATLLKNYKEHVDAKWNLSGAWNVHEESFFPKLKPLSSLTCRVSYSWTGTPPASMPRPTADGCRRTRSQHRGRTRASSRM